MPNKSSLALWKKSLEELHNDIELMQRQYDAVPVHDSMVCLSPAATKRQMLADMIYDAKIRMLDLQEWIRILEAEGEE